MLDDYKEVYRQCADLVEGWQALSKNDLCRKYVESEGNPQLQNSYFSAIMCRYWNLIAKYHFRSSNVASPEDCYEWLVDSVYGCLKATSWEREGSSIHKDPNGPDKVINRCMKCARLTYYQFINRKKRKDNFGILSLDELAETSGTTAVEVGSSTCVENQISSLSIKQYILDKFNKKDYFVAVLIDCLLVGEVFDTVIIDHHPKTRFNVKKLCRIMSNIDEEYIINFSHRYDIEVERARQCIQYVSNLSSAVLKSKIQLTFEKLKHDPFFQSLGMR